MTTMDFIKRSSLAGFLALGGSTLLGACESDSDLSRTAARVLVAGSGGSGGSEQDAGLEADGGLDLDGGDGDAGDTDAGDTDAGETDAETLF